MARYVVSTDGSWFSISEAYIVEINDEDIDQFTDALTDIDREDVAVTYGVPVRDLDFTRQSEANLNAYIY